jgi:ribosomal protein S18 acetylase RimI-like enzyme
VTNLRLLAEVRRFFPHARLHLLRSYLALTLHLRGGLRLVVDDGWPFAEWEARIHDRRNCLCVKTGDTPAEALRALGFAKRRTGTEPYLSSFARYNRALSSMAKQNRKLRMVQLCSRQRHRKGALLGARKRREAANAIHP